MKGKKTIIISSLVMCLTLIVAIVSVTAAWFGNVTQQQLQADLTVDSGTVSASADIQLDSGASSQQALYPAVAEPGYYLSGKGGSTNNFFNQPAPGNYGIYPAGDSFNDPEALYPKAPVGPDNLPPANATLHLQQEAKVAKLYFTIKYAGPADAGATDGKKSIALSLSGVYLKSQLIEEDGKFSGYDNADVINYRNEFNVRMALVQKNESDEYETLTSNSVVHPCVGNIYYADKYSESNPYGHTMEMRINPNTTYTVEFQIYFNKIDEECNMDLLNTDLVLHIELNQAVNYVPTTEG